MTEKELDAWAEQTEACQGVSLNPWNTHFQAASTDYVDRRLHTLERETASSFPCLTDTALKSTLSKWSTTMKHNLVLPFLSNIVPSSTANILFIPICCVFADLLLSLEWPSSHSWVQTFTFHSRPSLNVASLGFSLVPFLLPQPLLEGSLPLLPSVRQFSVPFLQHALILSYLCSRKLLEGMTHVQTYCYIHYTMWLGTLYIRRAQKILPSRILNLFWGLTYPPKLNLGSDLNGFSCWTCLSHCKDYLSVPCELD